MPMITAYKDIGRLRISRVINSTLNSPIKDRGRVHKMIFGKGCYLQAKGHLECAKMLKKICSFLVRDCLHSLINVKGELYEVQLKINKMECSIEVEKERIKTALTDFDIKDISIRSREYDYLLKRRKILTKSMVLSEKIIKDGVVVKKLLDGIIPVKETEIENFTPKSSKAKKRLDNYAFSFDKELADLYNKIISMKDNNQKSKLT